ncbi:MAG: acetyl-CoA acetyltransferase [Pseudomonadota bacterium]
MASAYIVDAVRTPRARRKGKFSKVHAVDLLTYPLNSVVNRSGVAPELVQDVLVGCVTQTQEQGWCVGRAAVLAAGWPISVPATTINRLCGSGQQAVNFASASVESGHYDLVVAGGLEHMTRVPMFSDAGGEESPLLKHHHPDLVQQGMAAEILSQEFGISRAEADEFAYRSQINAKKALIEGRFKRSMVPVPYTDDQGVERVLEVDDNPRSDTTIEGLKGLKTVFKEDGIITAGNASAIVDGAAAVLIASEGALKRHSLTPRARVVAQSVVGSPPRVMLTGPIAATQQVLTKAGLLPHHIDVWEINEAFAPVPLLTMREIQIDQTKVNINGGGISLGHPLGATGAVLIGMALDELERTQKRYALVTMCIGLGMGIATIIERV